MARRPDESLAAGDHEARAREMQSRHPGWLVWWGKASQMYDAIGDGVPVIVSASTPDALTTAIAQWEAWVRAARAEQARAERRERSRPDGRPETTRPLPRVRP